MTSEGPLQGPLVSTRWTVYGRWVQREGDRPVGTLAITRDFMTEEDATFHYVKESMKPYGPGWKLEAVLARVDKYKLLRNLYGDDAGVKEVVTVILRAGGARAWDGS